MDWVNTFALKIKTEEHYGLPYDKTILSEKLGKLIDEYKQKAGQKAVFCQLPVNKRIIGKNSQVLLRETVEEADFRIEMWAHETYVLPNRPFGSGNLELPE